MGLAASQARLLSITQRISDNELRAQLINNQKMRLNSESSKVSENYINALNKTNLVFANYDSEDKAQNVPLTFKNLTAFNQYNNQYNLTNTAGNVLISEDDAEKYKASGGNLENFLEKYGITYTTSYWDTIANQLKDCEAYYTTPNLDGKLEFASKADKDSGTSINDGSYAFFTADELKAMYEGTNTGIKYEAMAKHPDYIDFTKYFDIFTQEMVKYDDTVAQQGIARAIALDNIFKDTTKIPQISAGDITLSTDTPPSLKIDKILSNWSNVLDISSITGTTGLNVNNYLSEKDKNLSTFGIDNYNASINKYTGTSSWETTHGTELERVSANNLADAPNSLYLFYGGNYYVQVLPSSDDGQTFWMQLNTSSTGMPINTSAYWNNNTTSNIFILKDGALTIPNNNILSSTDSSGNTSNYGINFNNNILTRTETYTPSGGTSITASENIILPSISDTTISDPQITYEKSDLENRILQYVNQSIVRKMLEDLIESGAKVKSPYSTDNLTPEQQTLVNTPVTSDIPEIISSLSQILVKEEKDNNGNTIWGQISDGKEMQALLEAIMTGTRPGLVRNSNGTYTATYSYKDSTTLQYKNVTGRPLSDTAVSLINALVCDTMMDYFGEPVYGYMKRNASGELVVADEEARWYTNLFNKIKSCGFQVLADGLANSTDWMQFALENGIVVMEQINSEQNWQPITHTSCSDVIEQTDTQAATLAEAEYNKAMRQIEAKDEMFDLELKNIDTEHASLESEYESVKKAMTGNIERTFQMYG